MKIENQSILQQHPIDIKIKLACLWASLMFCYIYCDFFELYSASKIETLIQGKSMLDNPNKVLMAAVMMSVPALMISLSIFLKPLSNKVLNIAISLFFACLLTMIAVSLDVATHGFYIYFAIIEIILTLFISYKAYKWPKHTPN